MKLLRLTIFGQTESHELLGLWTNLWFTSMAEVEDYLKMPVEGTEAILESVEVPTTKEGIACALNLAEANHTTWPGTRIRNIDLRTRKQ